MDFLLGFLFENRYALYHAALHSGLMGTDTYAGPVSTVNVAGDRIPVLQDAADKLMNQVGMGTPVATPLEERQMRVAVIIHRLPGKAPDLRGQAVRVVRDLNAFLSACLRSQKHRHGGCG